MPTTRYFKEALSNISQGLLIIGKEREVIYVNEPYRAMLKVPLPLATEGSSVEHLLRYLAQRGDYGRGDIEEQVRRRLQPIVSAMPYEDERRRPNGRFMLVSGAPFDDGGYVFTVTDVTERHLERERLAAEVAEKTRALRKANRELSRLALLDPLLGIPNRRRFSASAGDVHRGMVQSGHPSVVMMIDIDHFKAINDEYGHTVGDAVLVQIAARIRSALKPGSHLARYGGEEFIVLLPLTAMPAGAEVAERLRLAVAEKPITIETASVATTVSVGATEWQIDDATIDIAVSRADVALYEAKRSGRNLCRFYRCAPVEEAHRLLHSDDTIGEGPASALLGPSPIAECRSPDSGCSVRLER